MRVAVFGQMLTGGGDMMRNRELKAVIFDMDGVLIDSEPIHFLVEQQLFRQFGLRITEEEQHAYVGVPMREMWKLIRTRHSLTLSEEQLLAGHKEQLIAEFSTAEPFEAMEGLRELLSEIKNRGLKTAVASSSPRQLIETVLARLRLTPMFDVIVSGEEVKQGKPSPDIFIEAASLLQATAGECIVIEDSCNGVRAAKSAGMECIGFYNPNSGNQDLSGADRVIRHFSEITGGELQ
ncbi:HAD family hydrolase [Paenibacillus elgii]|nr:HAD family hydrolase [Paenibacillus elgii]